MRLRTALLILFFGTGISFGAAKKAGPEALRDFASEQPDHPKALVALELADELDWTAATTANTEASYQAYLEASPGGSKAEEAAKRADAASWATTTEDPVSLRAHLETYPNGAHQFEGWRTLEQLDLGAARKNPSLEVFVQHLERYPRNLTSTEAAGDLVRIIWPDLEKQRQADTPTALLLREVDVAPPAKKVRVERLLDIAEQAMHLEQYELALTLSGLVVHYNPTSPWAWDLRGRVYRRMGDSELEEEHLQKALAQDLPGMQPHYNLALLRVRQGRFDEAREILQRYEIVDSPDASMKGATDGAPDLELDSVDSLDMEHTASSGGRSPYAAPKFKNPDSHFYLHRAALYAAEGKAIAWREYSEALRRLPKQPLLTQIMVIEDLRHDALYAPLREDSRFKGLPTLQLD